MSAMRLSPPLGPLPAAIAGDVNDAEYARWLGYPRGASLPDDELIQSRAAQSRQWFAAHARHWAVARRVQIAGLDGGGVITNAGYLPGRGLGSALADAHEIVMVAVSAGPEVDEEVAPEAPARQTPVAEASRRQETPVDEVFKQGSELSSPSDWDDLMELLANDIGNGRRRV